MKTRLQRWPGHSALRCSAPVLALSLFLAALPAGADTTFTSTGWLSAVPMPGITCTNGTGQVARKGNVHVVRLQADDARATGRLQAWMDLAYQPNGTALFSGPAYCEVGTWDAAGTNFTPSGGVWSLNYSGVAQADGSCQYSMAGYGIGGSIEGMRITVEATRAAPGDPTTPYLASGIIKPAPVNTSVVLDDFEGPTVKSQWIPWSASGSTPQLIQTNGQLTVRGVWTRPATLDDIDHTGAYWLQNWSVVDGQTLEWRADVTSMSQDASGVGFGVGTGQQRFYVFKVLSNVVWLDRWSVSSPVVPLLRDSVSLKRTNIVLSFALTRLQAKAVVTLRVLDKDAQNAVLYQTNVLDNAPYLSGNEIALAVAPKPGLPNSVVTATFDNYERRTYEVPQVAIERAARLTWPTTGMNFAVEAAPTVQGPWLPVQDPVLPGLEQKAVPANDLMKFFRLQQAP